MNKHLRNTLPLVGAAALVSTALMAGTGAALADKAAPTATVNSTGCDTEILQGEFWRTVYDATLWLDHNKGRWLFVKAVVEYDLGGTEDTNYKDFKKVDKNHVLTIEAKDHDTVAQGAKLVLTFGDRKGKEVGSQLIRVCH